HADRADHPRDRSRARDRARAPGLRDHQGGRLRPRDAGVRRGPRVGRRERHHQRLNRRAAEVQGWAQRPAGNRTSRTVLSLLFGLVAANSGITSRDVPSRRVWTAMSAGPLRLRASPMMVSDWTLSLPFGTIVM